MADYQLGSLYYEVKADTRGVKRGLQDADKAAGKARRGADKLRDSFKKAGDGARGFGSKLTPLAASLRSMGRALPGVGLAVTALASAFGVQQVMTRFIENTKRAEAAQAQLKAALKSTGEAAGFTQTQLNAMAGQLEGSSLFSADEIRMGQARLLSYTNVIGEQFPKAMQAAVDQAERLGLSMEQSAEMVGRALDIPSQGMASLSRQGFKFTEEQKKMVKQLERTGKVAQAQEYILDALESSYGGAAKAARDTFAGALKDLQNAVSDLLTGGPDSLNGLSGEINGLADQFRDPEMKRAITTFTGWIVEGMSSAAGFIRSTVQEINALLGLFNKGADLVRRGALAIIEKRAEIVKNNIENGSKMSRWYGGGTEKLQKEYEDLIKKRDELRKALEKPIIPVIDMKPSVDGNKPRPIASGDDNAVKAENAAKAYLQALKRQIAAAQKLSNVEMVLRDIEEGRLKVTKSVTKAMVVDVAGQLDAAEKLAAAKDKAKSLEEDLRTEQEVLNAKLAEYDDLLSQGAISTELHAKATANLKDEVSGLSRMIEAAPWKKLEEAQRDMQVLADAYTAGRFGDPGSMEAMARYSETVQERLGTLPKVLDDVKDGFQKLQESIEGWGKKSAEAIVEFAMTGKMAVGDMVKSMIAEILTMAVYENFTKPLASSASKFLGSALQGLIGRSAGGPVSANSTYRVNEGGPELYEDRGKQYLMTGSRAGKIVPLSSAAGGGAGSPAGGATINIENHYSFSQGVSVAQLQEAAVQISAQTKMEVAEALKRGRWGIA